MSVVGIWKESANLDPCALPGFLWQWHLEQQEFLIFVGEAFGNDPKVTNVSFSGVVGGERGCGQEIFYLHFGDSFLLDHRQEELHFKLSLTHVLNCLR